MMTVSEATQATVCASPSRPVIFLSHLPALSLAQLQRAFPPPHAVSNAPSWELLVATARERQFDVVFADPCVTNEHLAVGRLRDLALALERPPPIPVIAYVSVTAAAMRAVHALGNHPNELIIRGVDDTPDALAAAVNRVVTASAAIRLVESIGSSLCALPPDVSAAVESMFHRPDRVRSVSDLAAVAHMTRRSLDRWLHRAGLASARTLLACARASAAFHIMAAGRVRAATVAAHVGYTSPRSLRRELHALTGCSAAAIPSELTRDLFATALTRRLMRSPGESTQTEPSY